jgi:hypothetical protein
MTSRSRGLEPVPLPKHPLQITIRTPRGSDFKFEQLPLHSPLLRQSLLVSFPPLIDMLKFSGYPHLIRGQTLRKKGFGFCQASPYAIPERVREPATLRAWDDDRLLV